MKIRQGFVSNSSSSSFVIQKNAYANVMEIAEQMIRCREWDDDAKEVARLKKGIPKYGVNHPVSFNTCNYRTYIMPAGEHFLIETCNNHEFNLRGQSDYRAVPETVFSQILEQKPEILSELDNNHVVNSLGDLWEQVAQYLPQLTYYWFVDCGVVGRELQVAFGQRQGVAPCPEHSWSNKILLKTGEIICPRCQLKGFRY